MLTEKQAITEKFAANLRRIRQGRRLSQRALADEIDVNVTTLAAYEAGKKTPGIDKLVALAWALGVSVAELLGTEGDTKEDWQLERCVETAKKLGYDVSLMDDSWRVLMERRSERQQQIIIDRYDFMFRIEALENYLLSTPRAREIVSYVFFDAFSEDDDDKE